MQTDSHDVDELDAHEHARRVEGRRGALCKMCGAKEQEGKHPVETRRVGTYSLREQQKEKHTGNRHGTERNLLLLLCRPSFIFFLLVSAVTLPSRNRLSSKLSLGEDSLYKAGPKDKRARRPTCRALRASKTLVESCQARRAVRQS